MAGSAQHDPALQHSNYSVYLKDDLLFGYFEYHGTDYVADMARMAADPKTQEWWAIMMPMQKPLETRAPASGGPIWKRFFIAIDLTAPRGCIRFSAR